MKAVILAAGIGSRLDLKDLPKPMYEIDGKPILEHNVKLLKEHDIKDICITLHHKGEVIKDYFKDGKKFGVSITYVFEKELLGTSGGVKNIEWFLNKEPFFVIYGDNYTSIDLSDMLKSHLLNRPLATIALFDPKKVMNSGIAGGVVLIDANNKIVSFKEGTKDKSDGYVNAGIYILEPEIISKMPKEVLSDFGKDIFPKLVKEGFTLKAYLTNSFVLAIDTKEALKVAENILEKGKI